MNRRRQVFPPSQPNQPTAAIAADKERYTTNFVEEEDVLPDPNHLSIQSIHTMTKSVISTLSTIDKSLDLTMKALTLFDNYRVGLSALTNGGTIDGFRVLRMLSGFINRIDLSQLEQIVNLLQSPMFLGLLTSGFDFSDEQENEENEAS